jgi:hypothetical protein
MTAGHELIPELMIDLLVPPMLTGLCLLFVSVNNGIVDQNGKGSKIEAHPWRLLIQMYFVAFVLALIHFHSK